MSVESTAIKARSKRYGVLNDLYIQYLRLRTATINVLSIYEDADERDEKAFEHLTQTLAICQSKCSSLEDFLLKEKEVLTRMMASEDCEARK